MVCSFPVRLDIKTVNGWIKKTTLALPFSASGFNNELFQNLPAFYARLKADNGIPGMIENFC